MAMGARSAGYGDGHVSTVTSDVDPAAPETAIVAATIAENDVGRPGNPPQK